MRFKNDINCGLGEYCKSRRVSIVYFNFRDKNWILINRLKLKINSHVLKAKLFIWYDLFCKGWGGLSPCAFSQSVWWETLNLNFTFCPRPAEYVVIDFIYEDQRLWTTADFYCSKHLKNINMAMSPEHGHSIRIVHVVRLFHSDFISSGYGYCSI